MSSPFVARRLSAAALLIVCAPCFVRGQSTTTFVTDFDSFIARAMATGFSPGMAVAVVQNDTIIYSKGFGVANLTTRRPVDADTQFYIGSTTKSFTALTAAALAARGDMDLDAPLSTYLPQARLGPGLDPETITLRSLLTHTHGIRPEGPVDFRTAFTGEFNDGQLIDLLRFHPPATTGRAFSYSNLGYNIFSLVLDTKYKEGWKALIDREVFRPLDMTRTTAFVSQADRMNLAMPHIYDGTRSVPVAYAKQDANMHAAGGHLSTAHDLARYLLVHINGGAVGRKQLLPAALIESTHVQQASQMRTFGPFRRFGWSLGWDMATYEGDTILQRFGSFPGFRSHVSFMPERRIGVVVLSNDGLAGSPLTDIIATYIYDRILAKPDLATKYDKLLEQLSQQVPDALARDRATRAARPQVTPLPLSAYAGTYDSEALGRMEWTFVDGHLKVKMGIAEGDVEVYDGTRYQLRVDLSGGGTVVTFVVPEGAQQPSALKFLDYEFVRVSNRQQ
jgi:CubicO group peptidase (beta-lactamase class C family)